MFYNFCIPQVKFKLYDRFDFAAIDDKILWVVTVGDKIKPKSNKHLAIFV